LAVVTYRSAIEKRRMTRSDQRRRVVVRFAMTAAHRVRTLLWSIRGRPVHGVRAVVVTPAGRIVLVRQTYTQGWHLPAGGRGSREHPRNAILRELREEIGLVGGAAALVDEVQLTLGRRSHLVTTFVVRDAAYRPRRNLEIEEVAEFPPDRLPADLTSGSRAAIDRALAEEVA
jgi:8-oxo-dGTP pyrophosphatase MutT (NUDIX family)